MQIFKVIHQILQKHRAWLNQRTHDRQLVGYVETNDPYQKIKYFKKLIKFKSVNEVDGNHVVFVPQPENSIHFSIKHPANSPDTEKKFSYNIIDDNHKLNSAQNIANNSKTIHDVSEPQNNNVVNEAIEQQTSSIEAFDTTTNMITIEREQNSNKIHDDVDIQIQSNSMQSNNSFWLNNSKKHLDSSLRNFELKKIVNENLHHNTNRSITVKKTWSRWSSWSECSRTCGDGIKSQTRECILKT